MPAKRSTTHGKTETIQTVTRESEHAAFLDRLARTLKAGASGGRYAVGPTQGVALYRVLNTLVNSVEWGVGDILNYAIRYRSGRNADDLVKIAAHAAMLWDLQSNPPPCQGADR